MIIINHQLMQLVFNAKWKNQNYIFFDIFFKTSSKPVRNNDTCFGRQINAGRNLIESKPHPQTENPKGKVPKSVKYVW